jgi:hypothetical protein
MLEVKAQPGVTYLVEEPGLGAAAFRTLGEAVEHCVLMSGERASRYRLRVLASNRRGAMTWTGDRRVAERVAEAAEPVEVRTFSLVVRQLK